MKPKLYLEWDGVVHECKGREFRTAHLKIKIPFSLACDSEYPQARIVAKGMQASFLPEQLVSLIVGRFREGEDFRDFKDFELEVLA